MKLAKNALIPETAKEIEETDKDKKYVRQYVSPANCCWEFFGCKKT